MQTSVDNVFVKFEERRRFALVASQVINLFVLPQDFIWLQMIYGFSTDTMEVFRSPSVFYF